MATARVFRSGNSQAVRLPKEFRLTSKEVEIFRRGDEIVLREKGKGLARAFEILANLPNRVVAWILKFVVQPFGARVLGPSDRVVHRCAQIVLEPSAARDRLTPDLAHVEDDGGCARLERAFLLVAAAEDAARKMRVARLHDRDEAVKQGVITQSEADKLAAAHEAVAKVIDVDDFAPEALSPIYRKGADVHQFFQELGEQRAAS